MNIAAVNAARFSKKWSASPKQTIVRLAPTAKVKILAEKSQPLLHLEHPLHHPQAQAAAAVVQAAVFAELADRNPAVRRFL
jgi:hypothetical protein